MASVASESSRTSSEAEKFRLCHKRVLFEICAIGLELVSLQGASPSHRSHRRSRSRDKRHFKPRAQAQASWRRTGHLGHLNQNSIGPSGTGRAAFAQTAAPAVVLSASFSREYLELPMRCDQGKLT